MSSITTPLAGRRLLPRTLSVLITGIATLTIAGCSIPGLPGQGNQSGPPAPVPTQAPSIPWSKVTLPEPAAASSTPSASTTPTATGTPGANTHGYLAGSPALGVSPADGHAAWYCQKGVKGFDISATTDGGADWVKAVNVAPVTVRPVTLCRLTGDGGDNKTVAATFSWGSTTAPSGSTAYISHDSGQTWKHLTSAVAIYQMITNQGKTYFLGADPLAPLSINLYVSSDNLLTAHKISPLGLNTVKGGYIFAVGANAGEVAVSGEGKVYHTADAGKTWTSNPLQGAHLMYPVYVTSKQQWLVCAQTGTDNGSIQCSSDLGKTWSPITPYKSPGGSCVYKGITPTGTLLAPCQPAEDTSGANNPNHVFNMYQMLLGGTAWTSLGTSPGDYLVIPATGPIWAASPADATSGVSAVYTAVVSV